MSKVFTIMEGLENMGALRTGGQGSVYKGRRIGPILSAVKLLPTPIANESLDDKNYRKFVSEVEKLKKVNEVANPNVVKILSWGITESGSLPFIEMEFIEGPDLCELLSEPHEKIFSIKETIKLADQLAGALAHCHKVGVKHGDIKSNNIKFNIHTGNYVLLDFGLSIMSDEERRSSMRHAGAIEFMAPEQNEGQMLFQTDIYSFGVVLFELLAGSVPFPLHDNGETARNTVMIAHMESPVPDLLSLRKENLPKNWTAAQQQHEMQVPAWLLNIIYKCLEKKPEDRYANGMYLQDAIVENSVSAGNTDSNIVALKTENETLQTILIQLQEAALFVQKSTITVPRSLFNGGIVFIIILVGLSVYGLSSKKIVYQSSPQATTAYVPFMFRYTPPNTTAINQTKDSIAKARKSKARAPIVKKRKAKKKKFLGLF
ncbi:MAG: Serine/threonine protein kinase [Mucilaginibacter sp.]|uniref:serine/threonine protein kinase n=1 Tax=Mucilaginibacter sp. TaxID=1882438 RepID=UPI00262C459D|nr:serine/threonine-protein kinase [Mucilaginibacter sp.]MDB5005517.1 Serine/threonine protein kinase [Mucilaginibacter sp.]